MYKDSVEEMFCDMYETQEKGDAAKQKTWTPGQRLNSAAEALRALADGQKLTTADWGPEEYIELDQAGFVVNEMRNPVTESYWVGWHIYTPPKRTRETRVWVNVYPEGEAFYATERGAVMGAVRSRALAVAVPCKITVEY